LEKNDDDDDDDDDDENKKKSKQSMIKGGRFVYRSTNVVRKVRAVASALSKAACNETALISCG
jgi:hypothetical protein